MAAKKPGRRLRLPKHALAQLRDSHRGMAQVMDRVRFDMRVGYDENDLQSLTRSIISQQVSGAAARTIFGRFRALYDDAAFPSAETILSTHHTRLKKVGLSRQKAAAIRDLCKHVVEGRLPLDTDALRRMPDDAVVDCVSAVRGIGRWSAQMFLMFHLGRRDVWPTGDLGVQKGAQRVLGLATLPTPKVLEPLGDRFAPFRSVAAWYLWRALELPPQAAD